MLWYDVVILSKSMLSLYSLNSDELQKLIFYLSKEILEHSSSYGMETSEETTTPLPNYRICRLKPDKGPCKAKIKRWYFDPAFGECKEFIYGGCKGNANNFETYKECSDSCLMNKKSSKQSAFVIYNSYY